MKTRAVVGIIVGVVACLIGAVWIAQGLGAAKGSMMSGHKQYSALGLVVVLAGLALLAWSWRNRATTADREKE